jgi:hypothetical protein
VQICPECSETQWPGVTKCIACGAVLTGIPADARPESVPEHETVPEPEPVPEPESVHVAVPGPAPEPEPEPALESPPTAGRRARPVIEAPPDAAPARRRAVTVGMGLAAAVIALVGVVALGGGAGGSHDISWATRITPLGTARVSLPDDCRLTPPRDGNGGKLGALDCWLNLNSEVGVLEAHLATRGVNAMATGTGMVQRMLHGSVDSVAPSGKQDGTEFDLKGHGLVASRDAMLSAHLLIRGDDVVVVFGIGLGQMPPTSLQRAVSSIRLA